MMTAQEILEAKKAAIAAGAAAGAGAAEAGAIPEKICTYYSRGNGSRYYFKDGTAAEFAGGQFSIADTEANKSKIAELEYVCRAPHQAVFSLVPVALIVSDARAMREVNNPGGGVASGTGFVNSQTGGAIQQDSN